ncbi:Cof-type HAD-IIB family hydrolase [Niallia endozanthoxylica]|uniref:Cof-type HAD-IIB family hydrolase n=1 Tax=Niallia endozanthoxylica TaxID=2036016 RepID=A0A5J5H198_9BACI|nr:Cof-type HAD-IIB family hydrolase [Niallia endozanthoxylica]KAA9014220.1 Cof-type HAD-IIB family hydrolase [Niallia endozanthoxylica]
MADKPVIFFDLDGTLLTSQLQVAASSVEAIKKIREGGAEPVIATGRAIHEIEYVLEATGITSCVAMNGQYVMYNGEVIYENPLLVEEVTALHAEASRNGHDMAFYNAEKITVTAEDSELIRKNYVRVGGEYPVVDSCLYENEPIHLMLIFCEIGEEIHYQEQFPYFQFVRNSPYGCDIYPAGTSKATGIKQLLSLKKLSLENTYAFGDGLNDLEMFDLVKHPVAMGNATEILKQSASYITSSHDEDGIQNGLRLCGLLK